jgi:hypothetical protein
VTTACAPAERVLLYEVALAAGAVRRGAVIASLTVLVLPVIVARVLRSARRTAQGYTSGACLPVSRLLCVRTACLCVVVPIVVVVPVAISLCSRSPS